MNQRIALAAAFLALLCRPAAAHQPGVSIGEIQLTPDRVRWEILISAEDWTKAFFLHGSRSRILNESDVRRTSGEIETILADLLRIRAGGRECPGKAIETMLTERQGHAYVRTLLEFNCPEPITSLTLEAPVATYFLPQHRLMVLVKGLRGSTSLLFGPGQDVLSLDDLDARWGIWPQARRFIRLGIEHIFTGYDHILFLFGLVLAATGLRNLVGIITSFTLAHTITLAAATLGYVSLSPRVVEPLIAASIVYIAVENLYRKPAKRWLLTFGFGLIHGLGFSSILLDLNVPRNLLATALLSFNGGVEIGQVAMVGTLYPLIRLARRFPRAHRLILRAGSGAILAMGLLWLLQRTVFA